MSWWIVLVNHWQVYTHFHKKKKKKEENYISHLKKHWKHQRKGWYLYTLFAKQGTKTYTKDVQENITYMSENCF